MQKGEGFEKGSKSRVPTISSSQPKVQYVYYKKPDDLFKRLELLCGERDIASDSIEVRNEVDSILDVLLKQNASTSYQTNLFIINGVTNVIF